MDSQDSSARSIVDLPLPGRPKMPITTGFMPRVFDGMMEDGCCLGVVLLSGHQSLLFDVSIVSLYSGDCAYFYQRVGRKYHQLPDVLP